MPISDTINIIEKTITAIRYLFGKDISIYLYKKIIMKSLTSNINVKLRGFYDPVNLTKSRVFNGLVYSLFKADGYHFSTVDLASAINIATGHFFDNTFNSYSHEIIDFSYYLSREIKENIIQSKIIKESLKGYGKDISLIDTESDRNLIEFLFKNKSELFKHYFSTFHDCSYNYTIKIWHQGNQSTSIDWSDDNSLNIQINPYKIREGFFLQGFDYLNVTDNDRLRFALNKNGYEYFNQEISGAECIWLQ